MPSRLITAPTQEPLTMEQVKQWLNVQFDDHDALIQRLLKSGRQECEKFTGLALFPQVWDVFFDEFPTDGGPLKIYPAPVLDVEGIFYGAGGDELAAATYVLDAATRPTRIALANGASWPNVTKAANTVRVRVRSGLVDPEASPETGEVPEDLNDGILLMIGAGYLQRENIVIGQAVNILQHGAFEKWKPHRIHTGMA